MKKIIVTIDGPAASGKGRIAKYISRRWKLKHLDSGILYRRLAFLLNKYDININSLKEIKDFVNNLEDISFKKHKNLRNEKISKISSQIAVHKFVRIFVNSIQKKIVNKNLKRTGFVIDGRDIGSIVFKHADLKLYIDVNEQNRAKRRYKQLIVTGEKSIYPKILKDIKLRDKKDKNRINSPLVIPKDAHHINNERTFKETTNQINILLKKF